MAEQCVILNDIHIDIMDYIKPAYCTEQQASVKITLRRSRSSMLLVFTVP